jgi:hypothetical protein
MATSIQAHENGGAIFILKMSSGIQRTGFARKIKIFQGNGSVLHG